MASGKRLKKQEPHFVTLHHNDGQPVRRAHPKERMSKKERLRQRREEKGPNTATNRRVYGDITQGSNKHYEQNR
jgi:hypothetical protein